MKVTSLTATRAILLALFCMQVSAVFAQEGERDPTRPPAAVEAPADAAPNGADKSTAGIGTNVVVREGKPFLVVGTRLVAPGQSVGDGKLERITETEVWIRNASGLQKISRFAGVQRTVQKDKSECSVSKIKPAKTGGKTVKSRPAPVAGTASVTDGKGASQSAGNPSPVKKKSKPAQPKINRNGDNELHDC